MSVVGGVPQLIVVVCFADRLVVVVAVSSVRRAVSECFEDLPVVEVVSGDETVYSVDQRVADCVY